MMKKKIENLIKKIKKCAQEVYKELGSGWSEEIYQKALEVILREKRIKFEAQRVLPISFKGYIIGEGRPDLIVWFEKEKKKVAIVIDLKATQNIQEDHKVQVERYIQELKTQLKENEDVYPIGFIFDFTKPSQKSAEGVKDLKGLKILEVKTKV
jgi:GxxExxY protein